MAGDLRVDVGQQRVTRSGMEITLPNLSFQLLVALIRVAPNVLSHDLLMARVWPGLVVSPETLNKHVNLLREALGDERAGAALYRCSAKSRLPAGCGRVSRRKSGAGKSSLNSLSLRSETR